MESDNKNLVYQYHGSNFAGERWVLLLGAWAGLGWTELEGRRTLWMRAIDWVILRSAAQRYRDKYTDSWTKAAPCPPSLAPFLALP